MLLIIHRENDLKRPSTYIILFYTNRSLKKNLMQNLIKIYTPRLTILHIFSKFSRWGAWPLACVQLLSLFLYENSHFLFRMLSKYTLKRINYTMFSKKLSESYNQTQTCSYIFSSKI